MKFRAVENKARLALALFVLALVLTIGLSLGLYSEARRDLSNQREQRLKLEIALLASELSLSREETDAALLSLLKHNRIQATAALYSEEGRLIARAGATDPAASDELLSPETTASSSGAPQQYRSPAEASFRLEGGFEIAEMPARPGAVLVLARPTGGSFTPLIFYVFTYVVVALVLGLALFFILVRWLLKPYRRMVEAARGSPVHADSAKSESEFVVETFQALIEQLQAKERELALLHESERRRAERSERFSERLISNIPSGLITIDSTGIISSANQQAINVFGAAEPSAYSMTPKAASGKLMMLASDYRAFLSGAPALVSLIEQCLASGAAFRREEVEVLHPDGRVKHLGLSISPITDGTQKIEGALCLMTDLTEVVELRERMKLQESLANLGEMAAGLAHEFKNSLATIHGYVQLLEAQAAADVAASERRASVNATLTEVNLLARLVTDFLNFARPQQLTLSPVSLRSVIEDCAQEIRAQLDEAGIELVVSGSFADLMGDESLLRRAFVNLMRNAAEAIDPQSQEKLIEVTGSTDGGRGRRYAHIRIRDTGGGISTGDLSRIFIPFFTTKSRGYGIGLAIVQKIIVAHGGSVSVEQSSSAGTVFHCRLPLGDAASGVE